MIVCICHRVSESEIARQAHAGLSYEDIQIESGVGTQCGSCEGCARDLVARCAAAGQPAAVSTIQWNASHAWKPSSSWAAA